MTADILAGDVVERLKELPSESVHLVVTSPPYHALRSYLENGHADKAYELGLEPTFDLYLERMVAVFREVRRVLRRDGLCAINMGDSYAQSGGNGKGRGASARVGNTRRELTGCGTVMPPPGFKPKDLIMQSSLLAEALRADGWWLRSKLPWFKRSAMPESTTDRPSTALEYVMLFAKSEKYFWDGDSVRRPNFTTADGMVGRKPAPNKGELRGMTRAGNRTADGWIPNGYNNPNGRNLRNSDFYFDSLSLAIEQARAELAHLEHLRERGGLLLDAEGEPLALDVNTEATTLAHFASFPRKLVMPLIQAGTSERGVCADCGAPWRRVTEKELVNVKPRGKRKAALGLEQRDAGCNWADHNDGRSGVHQVTTLGWNPSCKCDCDSTVPATVLDCFAGTGTTLFVALELGRRAIGIELSEKYAGMMKRRLRRAQLPLDLMAAD